MVLLLVVFFNCLPVQDTRPFFYTPFKDTTKQHVEDRIIIEFKYDAEGILRDLNDNSKRYRDINLLVCWQIDTARFEREGIEVEPIPQESVYYYGSTHLLYFPGIYQVGENLAVIELKTFLEQFKEKNP